MATADNTATTSISQLAYTHQKVRNLARGPLPDSILDELHNTAGTIEQEVIDTPAANWSEFGAKVRLLFDELTDAPAPQWLEQVRASIHGDIARLEAANG